MKKTLYVLLVLAMLFVMSCSKEEAAVASDTATVEKSSGPVEGAATNNGYPYNLTPVKYDSRADKYLYGINATVLPIVDGDFTMEIWRNFSSTVMQGLDECEAFKAMEKATGVKIKWLYPPAGQATDNFNLRVSSNDLPHIFSNPPGYPGGPAKAIDDEVYVDLTPYYDQGMMPNVQYLRETREDINRDWVDDAGRIFKFPVLDIIPTDPWSGMWVREDWVKELGLDLPTTIADWDEMLYAMKKAYGIAPLGT
jgi:putative aldouronate transport system substrate-binding protein